MVYQIIYDAVKIKAKTTPPNEYIGNVEMAAGIGIVLDEQKLELDFDKIESAEMLREEFLSKADEDKASDVGKILINLVKKYQVIKMVNETMDDLIILARDYKKICGL